MFGLIDIPAIRSTFSDIDEDNPIPLVAFLLIASGIDTFFILVGFNTSAEATTIAFMLMFAISLIGLIAMKLYLGGDDEEPIPFDKNPGLKGIALGLFLGVVILLINIVAVSLVSGLSLLPSGFGPLTGINYNSILFVPQFFSSAQVGQSSILDNAVFQVILTAPGEEGLKAAMLYGMYMLTHSEALSVSFAVGIWAAFHIILVQFSLYEVGLAILSGVIMYAGWRYTGSILTPILSHGAYDGMIAIFAGIH